PENETRRRSSANRVAHRSERTTLRPIDAMEPAGIARAPRQPARHSIRPRAAVCRADLPASATESDAGTAPRRARSAGQAGIRSDFRSCARVALRRRNALAELEWSAPTAGHAELARIAGAS